MSPARFAGTVVALAFAGAAIAADFGTRGGPEPANIDEVVGILRQDPYDLELLISFGTSKGGSAGHLALAIRGGAPNDDLVYSANFYADRSEAHAKGFWTDDLMARIPKKEYLFRTSSSLGSAAAFGLDFGEIYKRSVIGVRVYGVPKEEKDALTAFFARLNDDFHKRASDTEYHSGEIAYDYLSLNCAKTIGSAFRYGAGYKDLKINAPLIGITRVVTALNANLPTEMALKLLREWDARGYRMDAVLYKKYPGSTYADPHDDPPVQFKDLPNRFPSVLSLDFRKEEGQYRDYDNLYAMYVLYNLGKYSVRVGDDRRLVIDKTKEPLPYAQADAMAKKSARSDSDNYSKGARFNPEGTGYNP
ncbi:MAG: hypothetical protein WA190_08730 [Usitatibacter sp.]